MKIEEGVIFVGKADVQPGNSKGSPKPVRPDEKKDKPQPNK
jgi:hypothetical protein